MLVRPYRQHLVICVQDNKKIQLMLKETPVPFSCMMLFDITFFVCLQYNTLINKDRLNGLKQKQIKFFLH